MSSFAKTAFFVKNVPPAERALRIAISVAGAAAALFWLAAPWSWLCAASALGFALTGVVGFCPMCAMVGRRLDRTST